MDAISFGWLVLAFPVAGLTAISLLWSRLPGRAAGWIASGAILGSFFSSIGMFVDLQDRPEDARTLVDSAWTYAATADFKVGLSILVDPLSVFMCLVVSGVSFLIHVYSVAYMGSDRGYSRYFAYLNYFVFSMLLLVLAANFVVLIIGWAFVGAASYLLISFWYRRGTATYAGIKAFVMNVIGDVGLVIAAFLLLNETGTLNFGPMFAAAGEVFPTDDGTLIAACLLILVGAFAKSAQLPLHTWLPDAMEGPTPVSALIHAATMVTAGVYLIARMHPLFERAPAAADVGAVIGCEQSLDRRGGFRKVMPFPFGCFVVGGLALAGIPPFAGFFSKDEILLVIGEQGGWKWGLYVAGYLGAFLTAVYTWRMIFRAFFGDPVPEAEELAHGHLYHPPA